jgi:hypothetical protein
VIKLRSRCSKSGPTSSRACRSGKKRLLCTRITSSCLCNRPKEYTNTIYCASKRVPILLHLIYITSAIYVEFLVSPLPPVPLPPPPPPPTPPPQLQACSKSTTTRHNSTNETHLPPNKSNTHKLERKAKSKKANRINQPSVAHKVQ